MFCVHEWVKVHEHTSESAFEQLCKAEPSRLKGLELKFFGKKHICIIACNKCGKTKHYTN